MLVQCAFQVFLASAATGSDTAADDAMHHAHMPVTPGAHLLIDLQQVIQQLERQLQDGITAVQHDEERSTAGWRQITGFLHWQRNRQEYFIEISFIGILCFSQTAGVKLPVICPELVQACVACICAEGFVSGPQISALRRMAFFPASHSAIATGSSVILPA